MFDQLRDRLDSIFSKLTGRGALSEEDVDLALRDIRRALLEADVSLDVARDFVEAVRIRAVGAEVVKSITPGQMVVKIVHDCLVATLGETATPLNLSGQPPVVMMVVGLQGSGKTTTTAKIAYRLATKQNRKVLVASLDVYRPAAQEQLKVLASQVGVESLPIIAGQNPLAITARALEAARLGGYDVLLLDTAGRTHIDDDMMREAEAVKAQANPHEILLVADALTGQDAVNVARSFNERVEITGLVLTRIDGDGRGGAALSMRATTGKPIKLLGTGEKWDALEDFQPARLADRILNMGDVVSLVEKAAEAFDQDKAARTVRRMQKGIFDLNDLAEQIGQMQKMGGMGQLLGMLPGFGKLKGMAARKGLEDKSLKQQLALIQSMTKKERRSPQLLNFSRKQRIVKGAGASLQELNKLLKMHSQMAKMMKKLAGNPAMAGDLMGGMGLDPAQLSSALGNGMGEGLPAMDQPLDPSALSGLLGSAPGGGLPGLPGLKATRSGKIRSKLKRR